MQEWGLLKKIYLYSSTHGNECNNYEISPRAFLLPVNNSLRKLQLEGAQLNSSVFKEILKLNDFSSLAHLDVERNSLEDIPNLKTNLSNLEKLFIGHNPNLSCECPTLYNLQDVKDVLYLNEYKKVNVNFHLFCVSLTRLTWMIHTSFLPSNWNLGKIFALTGPLGLVHIVIFFPEFFSMREDGHFCYWNCDFPQN